MIGERPAESPIGPAAAGRYAVLTMDGLGLVIPQHEVHTLEPGLDVQRSEGDDIGWIAVLGKHLPVYCLSEDLNSIRKVPANRNICVLLEVGGNLFGVLCDQVSTLDQAELEILPLPHCMRNSNTPLRGLVVHDERVLCVSSARGLLACVGDKRVPTDDPIPSESLEGTAL